MASLFDKVSEQEAKNQANQSKKLYTQFSNQVEKNEHAVNKITHISTRKNKMVSLKINDEVYKEFTEINKRQGFSNNSITNMLINQYVRDHKELLDF